MAIVLKEYLGSPMGTSENTFTPFSLKEGLDTGNVIASDSVMVDIEGIHVGPTRNFTWYTEEALKSSIPTWTKPYQRPLILHHNEKDGKIIGRVLAANYTDMNTRSKTGALVFTCNVPDDDGKRGVRDGRLKTVSIGVIAHDVRCSICGHVISEYGECEHERGMEYDGNVCYWMIHKMEAKELSYVIVPSDIYAHNIKIYSPGEKNLSENLKQEGVLSVTKAKEIKESAEGTVIVEDAEKKVEAIVEDADKKVEETKQEPEAKEEPKVEAEDVETLKASVAKLKEVIAELEKKVEAAEAKAQEAEELRTAAEQELVSANTQLKEFAVEQVLMLREQLGRPTMLKENLLKRSQDSLMDTIVDLKEELTPVQKTVELTESNSNTEELEVKKSVDVTESIEEKTTEVEDVEDLTKVGMVVQESLLDEEKDSSIKKDDKVEKISGLDVKESDESSNSDYEATLSTLKFYNL
jgi:hypothetical protein